MTRATTLSADQRWMTRALELAREGEGLVESNPMVGCVIVQGGERIAEGWHQQFGKAHAEVDALGKATGDLQGATAYVTLEPCCHQGKTGPCSQALIEAGIGKVVIAMRDPFPQVSGGGIEQLKAAGIEVEVGVMEAEARQLNAPYLMRVEQKRPWVIAKWAMTLDGKIASRDLSSQWISNEQARQQVHQLRGRVDAIMVGAGTQRADDPLLTARPRGTRIATRVLLDRNLTLQLDSKLATTIDQAPLMIVLDANRSADEEKLEELKKRGCQFIIAKGETEAERLHFCLTQLAEQGVTNLLVEGGSQVLGSLFDLEFIDEVHAFIAPKLIGGEQALFPIAGLGLASMEQAFQLKQPHIEILHDNVYIQGRVDR